MTAPAVKLWQKNNRNQMIVTWSWWSLLIQSGMEESS